MIKNSSKTAHTLVAKEDPKLDAAGPDQPDGPEVVPRDRSGQGLHDQRPDAPYLRRQARRRRTRSSSRTPTTAGKFEIADIPAGAYKVKIWYRDGWLERPDDSVTVNAKGKTELNPKITALASPAGEEVRASCS